MNKEGIAGLSVVEIREWLAGSEHLTEEEHSALKNEDRAGARQAHRQWERKQKKKQDLLKEQDRLLMYEQLLHSRGFSSIVGVDEVGRGPLAGPVVSAAVILTARPDLAGVTDSKQLSPGKRAELYEKIKKEAVAYGIGEATPKEIDEYNIYEATKLSMMRAVEKLSVTADFLLIDAIHLPISIPQKSMIKGDANSLSIAAASILAKVTRDRIMERNHEKYPNYGFDRNVGYGTKEHMEALTLYGPSPIHRQSFAPVRKALERE